MRAVQFSEFSGIDALELVEVADPQPKAGEVVVKVTAVGLNFFDTLVLRDRYQFTPRLPASPGGEIAGVVEALGVEVKSNEVLERASGTAPAHTGASPVKIYSNASYRCRPQRLRPRALHVGTHYARGLHPHRRARLRLARRRPRARLHRAAHGRGHRGPVPCARVAGPPEDPVAAPAISHW